MLVANAGKIVVQRIGGPTETRGGLILPDTLRGGKSEIGTVVSCGAHDGWTEGMPRLYAPGSTVIFSKFSGSDIDLGGEHYIAMLLTDVLCEVAADPPAGRYPVDGPADRV